MLKGREQSDGTGAVYDLEVKVHPRQRPGGRVTDPADLPSEKTAYARRDVDHLIRMAAGHGPAVRAIEAEAFNVHLLSARYQRADSPSPVLKGGGSDALQLER